MEQIVCSLTQQTVRLLIIGFTQRVNPKYHITSIFINNNLY